MNDEEPLGASEWSLSGFSGTGDSYRNHNRGAGADNSDALSMRSQASQISQRGKLAAERATRSQIAMAGDDPVESISMFPAKSSFRPASEDDLKKKTKDGRFDDSTSIRERIARRSQKGELHATPRSARPARSNQNTDDLNVADNIALSNAKKSRESHFELSGDSESTLSQRFPKRTQADTQGIANLKSRFDPNGVNPIKEAENRSDFLARMQAKARGGWSLADAESETANHGHGHNNSKTNSPVPQINSARSTPRSRGTPRNTPRNTSRPPIPNERPSSRILRPKFKPPTAIGGSPIPRNEPGSGPGPELGVEPLMEGPNPTEVVEAIEPQPLQSVPPVPPLAVEQHDLEPQKPVVRTMLDLGANQESEAERKQSEKEKYAAELREMMRQNELAKKQEKEKRMKTKGDNALPTSFGQGRQEKMKQDQYQEELRRQMAEAQERREADHEEQVSTWTGETTRSRTGRSSNSRRW